MDYRLLAVPTDLIRDLGIDVRSPDGSSLDLRLTPAGCRSRVTWLDDTQHEVLLRAAEKVEHVHALDAGTVWFWAGEERVTRLGPDGVLTLACHPVRERFVRVGVRFRLLKDGGLVFVPRTRVTLPSGGSMVVAPAETLGRGTVGVPGLMLLLTGELVLPADVAPPAAAGPAPETG